MHVPRPMPLRSNSAAAWAAAFAAFAVALAARFALSSFVDYSVPYLTFVPAIIFAAYFSGLWPAIAIGIASILVGWYLFLVPLNSWYITPGGSFSLTFYAVISAIDILVVYVMRLALESRDAERAKSAALAEQREILFRELQHRVSNNLAIVSALINLQRADVADEQASRALGEASARLALIARIHRRLHDPSGARLRFGPFMEELCADVIEASGASNIAFHVTAVEAAIPESKIVPLALIVTELISNALEHGFAGRDSGTIRIDFRPEGKDHVLTIADDGNGLPEGFTLDARSGMGLRIVQSLIVQINGRLAFENRDGTVWQLVLANLEMPDTA
jgi:two-component sensor histidine kinase